MGKIGLAKSFLSGDTEFHGVINGELPDSFSAY